MHCSAVLLAGGKSSRMGCDKTFLEFEGAPLWRRQLATLRELSPAQLMISGPARDEWSECEIVPDECPGAGPLAGVAAALRKCTTPRLVVLAIDLPRMSANFLRSLAPGAVPRGPHGLEPLAAVYPATCAALAIEALRAGDHSMQNFVRRALAAGLLAERKLSAAEAGLFLNLNTPADL